jgi:MoaA/NifB/PqqE/SkfB family radical SAM enzyme
LDKRQLFVFWEFNGDNSSYCNLKCHECYGRDGKTYLHFWNGDVARWDKALTRLNEQHGNTGLYIVFSYGEALGSHGFLECVDMIGSHPDWTLCIVSNLLLSPEKLLQSRLAKEGRLFITASWHPEGVEDKVKAWETFKHHLMMVRAAKVPIHVMYCWHPEIITQFPQYFKWLDANNFRVTARRYLVSEPLKMPLSNKHLGGRFKLAKYSKVEQGYLYANVCPKVAKYGLNLVSPKGKRCLAGKDMLLIKYNGEARLCADCENQGPILGNVFDADFKLSSIPCRCPAKLCGGDYGMLHILDPDYPLLTRLERDNFVSIAEGLKETTPVNYPNRKEMLQWLEQLEK